MDSRQSGKGTPARRRSTAGRRSAAGRRKGTLPKGTLADRADKYDLYQRAVQEPEADIAFISDIFRERRGRTPRRLREDFCGTAATACRWVRTDLRNEAWAVDLDPEPLEWARRHNLAALTEDQAARLRLIRADVLEAGCPPVDLVLALNFSYFALRTRERLLAYFRAARRGLVEDGLLFLDLYGGPDAQLTGEEARELEGFTYVWDQASFDPVSHHGSCYIHFDFPDGSRLERAFPYEWRLWSIPEVRELLEEAGFRETLVYWEDLDEEGEGTGEYSLVESAEPQDAWVACVVALR